MADDKQQTREQVEATEPEPAPEPTPAKVQGYNYETGEFVR